MSNKNYKYNKFSSRKKLSKVDIARRFIKEAISPEDVDDITDDDMAMEADVRDAQEAFAEKAASKYYKITTRRAKKYVEEDIDGRLGERKQKRELMKLLKDDPYIMDWLDKYLDGNDHYLYKIRDGRFDGGVRKKRKSIMRAARKTFEKKWREEHHEEVLDQFIPKEMKQFLPENLFVEVDKDGVLETVTDRFMAKRETMARKIATQKRLVEQYNDIVRTIKQDLRSSNEEIRLAALCAAIIMETGFRPGKEGTTSTVKQEDGTKIEVETFGVTSLGPEHVDFVREFAAFEFVGKAATVNIGDISDREAIQVLEEYVESAREGDAKYIFVKDNGDRFTNNDLNSYLRDRWDNVTPVVMRRLKATEVTFAEIKEKKLELYEKINRFVEEEVDNLAERVTEEVVEVLENALSEAQETLHHDDVKTTIDRYVNPEIILSFLSSGTTKKNIKTAVMTDQIELAFDPEKFIKVASDHAGMDKAAGMGFVTSTQRYRFSSGNDLLTLMAELEEDLGIS